MVSFSHLAVMLDGFFFWFIFGTIERNSGFELNFWLTWFKLDFRLIQYGQRYKMS